MPCIRSGLFAVERPGLDGSVDGSFRPQFAAIGLEVAELTRGSFGAIVRRLPCRMGEERAQLVHPVFVQAILGPA